jgi:phosphoserine phosphatase
MDRERMQRRVQTSPVAGIRRDAAQAFAFAPISPAMPASGSATTDGSFLAGLGRRQRRLPSPTSQPLQASARRWHCSDGLARVVCNCVTGRAMMFGQPFRPASDTPAPSELQTASVLTLIATPDEPIPPAAIAAARERIAESGGRVDGIAWLGRGVACDIVFADADPPDIDCAVRTELAGQRLDLAVQPVEGRRKRLLLADMESTIITRELLDELAGFAGIKDQVAAITALSMRGEVDFAQSLRARVAMLTGLSDELIARTKALIELTPGARTLVATMRAHGARTVLVTGGFDCFAAVAAQLCGFDDYRANRLLVENGRFTGKVGEPLLGPAGKLDALEAAAASGGLLTAQAAAVGDGANDILMLRGAGLGVAFRGKPAVAAAARYRLDYADLTGLLYMQGYRAADFVS